MSSRTSGLSSGSFGGIISRARGRWNWLTEKMKAPAATTTRSVFTLSRVARNMVVVEQGIKGGPDRPWPFHLHSPESTAGGITLLARLHNDLRESATEIKTDLNSNYHNLLLLRWSTCLILGNPLFGRQCDASDEFPHLQTIILASRSPDLVHQACSNDLCGPGS